MSLRALVLVTHRWIGLATSVVLTIVGGTGALIIWPGNDVVHRLAGPLHESLALGRVGAWVVVLSTLGAVLLQLGGLYLWWRRKAIAVRLRLGWRVTVIDLHHAAGVIALVVMVTLAVTALVMTFATPESQPGLRRIAVALHTAKPFPFPIKVIYLIGTLGFIVQGATGVLMWWNARTRSATRVRSASVKSL